MGIGRISDEDVARIKKETEEAKRICAGCGKECTGVYKIAEANQYYCLPCIAHLESCTACGKQEYFHDLNNCPTPFVCGDCKERLNAGYEYGPKAEPKGPKKHFLGHIRMFKIQEYIDEYVKYSTSTDDVMRLKAYTFFRDNTGLTSDTNILRIIALVSRAHNGSAIAALNVLTKMANADIAVNTLVNANRREGYDIMECRRGDKQAKTYGNTCMTTFVEDQIMTEVQASTIFQNENVADNGDIVAGDRLPF